LVADTKKNKHDVIELITYSPDKFSKTGKTPKASPTEEPRDSRSFSNERERQLLRQASTQLYFKFKAELPGGLQEVEIMHMNFDGRNSLFIAVNESSLSMHVPALFSRENFQTILTTPYEANRDPEGSRRSRRYAAKLDSRIYSETPRVTFSDPIDKMRSEQVQSLLKTASLFRLEIELQEGNILAENSKLLLRNVFRKRNNEIYIVVVKKCPKTVASRHAEEYLSDIADYAVMIHQTDKIGLPLYTCVAGKKRPCMGCAARMQNVITQYGARPGRYFVHTGETQTDAVAARTVNLLLSSPSYVTRRSDGVLANGYDSASDSEHELVRGRRLFD
jgi:hypothetical protein